MKRVQPEEGESVDIVSENIERLKELFPESFSEEGVNFDVLRQLLGDAKVLDEGEEKYGLNWHGKKKARQIALTPSTGTLLPCAEESIDWDTTQNLFIEGDNLEVLKLLQKSYANKIKMIYIDPPYNTGKEFIYPDKFQENLDTYLKYTGQVDDEGIKFSSNTETTGRKHTNWLSMMMPRLRLSRNLLSIDGVIFVSIDNNEISNLLQLCNDVFGEENRLGIVANINNPKGRSDDKYFATAHEYVVVYAKSKTNSVIHGFEPEEKVTKRYNKEDKNGRKFREIDLRKTGDADKRSDRPDMYYYFYCDETGGNFRVSKEKDSVADGLIEIVPKKDDGTDGRWRWGFETAKTRLDELFPKFMPSRKIWGVFEKDFLEGRPPVKSTTAWTFKDVNSERGSEQFIQLGFQKEVFPRPKPIGTLKRVLEIGTVPNDEAIVLDFFAGSCGLFQAAFELQSQGKRQLRIIGVQLPEKLDENNSEDRAAYQFCIENGFEPNICSIAKERIRRAGTQIEEGGPVSQFDSGFKVLKLSHSNIQAWNPDRTDIEASLLANTEHLVEARSEQDILYELLLKRGVDLAVPMESRDVCGKSIYSIGYGVLFACLDESITKDQVEEIGQGIVEWHRELAPSSDSHVFFRDSAFRDDVSKTNMAAILEQNGITHVRSL
ncbi:MAG: site-specific DNA-methyltransferase [Candidatus Thiodiazotropha lotti]|nr:site-specific DNA-methyltransferase [Candidatus Thiodiazotropha lotti]